MVLHILRGGEVPAQGLYELLAAGEPVEIFPPFFVQGLVKGFLALHNAQLCHDLRVKEVVFKGIIFQDQHVPSGDSGEPVHVLGIPRVIIPAELPRQLLRILSIPVPDHQELVPDIDLVHIF